MKNLVLVCIFLMMLLVGTSLLSCKRVSYQYDYQQTPEADKSGSARPEILFMIFSIRQNDSSTTIQLKDTNVTYGVLKGQPENSHATDRIYVAQLRSDKTEISGLYIEHPLRKHVEYTNERNELTTKFVEVNEAEFFIRTTLDQQGAYVRLDEMDGDRVVNSFMFNIKG